jgi:hypothetical protein
MTVGQTNIAHVLQDGNCDDPDCELHHPEVIETESERNTACAWYLAGAFAMELKIRSEYRNQDDYTSKERYEKWKVFLNACSRAGRSILDTMNKEGVPLNGA